VTRIAVVVMAAALIGTLGACSGASPTPLVVYVTPPPTASPTLSPTASPITAVTIAPTSKPKQEAKPEAWTASYRTHVCSALDKLYDITPHLDAAGTAAGQGDVASTRSQVFEISSLALEATGELVDLPAWAPGDALVGYLQSAADDLGQGAATFIDGLDAEDQDRMRSGALQMDRGGSTVGSAQSEIDRLYAQYGGGC